MLRAAALLFTFIAFHGETAEDSNLGAGLAGTPADHCGYGGTCSSSSSGVFELPGRGIGLLQKTALGRKIAFGVKESIPVGSDAGACWFPQRRTDGLTQNVTPTPHVALSAHCPLQCPYSQLLSGERCFKACVPLGGCSQLHPLRTFADPSTHLCALSCGTAPQDFIVGCLQCQAPGRCEVCQSMHTLSSDGTRCESKLHNIFFIAYCVLGSLVAVILAYLIHLWCRPVVNSEVLRHAETHRELCIPMYLDEDNEPPAWCKFPLLTATHKDDITGVGVVLYFRWLQFLVFVVLVLFLATSAAFRIGVHREEVLAEPGSVRRPVLGKQGKLLTTKAQDCPVEWDSQDLDLGELRIRAAVDMKQRTLHLSQSEVTDLRPKIKLKGRSKTVTHGAGGRDQLSPAGDPRDYPGRMFIAMTVAYFIITFSSLWFAWKQTRFTVVLDEASSTHQDYVVRASGLPLNITEEDELKVFFQGVLDEVAPGDRVVGVSIAYNFFRQSEVIHDAVDKLLGDLSAESTPEALHEADNLEAVGIRHSGRVVSRKNRECIPNPVFRHLDAIVGPSLTDPKPPSDDDLRCVLRNMEGSGYAYIVLSSERAASQLASLSSVMCRDQKVSLGAIDYEPPSIIWESHFPEIRWQQVVGALSILIFTIVGWTLLYLPYAVFYTSITKVAGEEASFWQDTPLSLLIALGNVLVSCVIEHVAEELAFLEKDRRDVTILGLAFLSTLINTICDLGMVLIVTRGVMLDDAFESGREMNGYDRALSRELFNLVVPGYLLLPYILTPMFESVLPSYINRMLIRSSRSISIRSAEKALMCPDFNLCWRYSDILNNFTICLLLLFFTSPNTYTVMLWLILFHLMIYSMDHYKLLRGASRTFFTTECVSVAFSYWFSFPTGIAGSLAIWWGINADYFHIFGIPRLTCVVFLFLHVAVYCVMLTWLRRWAVYSKVERDEPYEEMCSKLRCLGKVACYFNSNPVHVLRSHLLNQVPGWEDDSPRIGEAPRPLPFVPYAKGKEHLHTETHMYETSCASVPAALFRWTRSLGSR